MQPEKQRKLSKMFESLSNPTRISILSLVMNSDEPTVPTLVATELNLTISSVGHSMKRMFEAGVLLRKSSGRYTFYSIDPSFLKLVKEFLT